MELWTGALSWWKCHWPDLKSAGLFRHSNPNPNPLANQLWCSDFLTPPTPLIIPHGLPAFLESLMPIKNWCSIHARWSKSSLKYSICFCGIFSKFKNNFIVYRSSKVSWRPDCIFEIHQLWQSGFSSNNILYFQESTTILNACTKKSGSLLKVLRILWTEYTTFIQYMFINRFWLGFMAYQPL